MATEAGSSSGTDSDSGFDADADSESTSGPGPATSAASSPQALPEGLLVPAEEAVPSVSQPAFVTAFQSANEKKRA